LNSRGGFAAENKGAPRHLEVRLLPQTIVEANDVEDIQVLAFVFVQAFDLNVE
jgi:hypothetical protein